jgi:hypothetical protein
MADQGRPKDLVFEFCKPGRCSFWRPIKKAGVSFLEASPQPYQQHAAGTLADSLSLSQIKSVCIPSHCRELAFGPGDDERSKISLS